MELWRWSLVRRPTNWWQQTRRDDENHLWGSETLQNVHQTQRQSHRNHPMVQCCCTEPPHNGNPWSLQRTKSFTLQHAALDITALHLPRSPFEKLDIRQIPISCCHCHKHSERSAGKQHRCVHCNWEKHKRLRIFLQQLHRLKYPRHSWIKF